MTNKLFCNRQGFTLIELMIVVSIIGVLASIAVPNYQQSVIRTREAVLSETLHAFRKAIDEYHADKGKYPDTLSDLVESKYLKALPVDPFTKKSDTWVTVAPPVEKQEETISLAIGSYSSADRGSVYDVHSGSNFIGLSGIPYNEW